MRGRAGVGVGGGGEHPRVGVDVPEPLWGAGETVGVVEAGVEPLRAVRGCHLVDEHVAELVFEGLGVGFGGEVAVPLTPVAPGRGEAVDHLAGGALRSGDRFAVLVEERFAVLVGLGDTRFPEVLRHHDVGGDLRPAGRDLGILHLEDDGTVGVGDLRVSPAPLDGPEGVVPHLGEQAADVQSRSRTHVLLPCVGASRPPFASTRPTSGRVIHTHKMLWLVSGEVTKSWDSPV